MLFHKRFEDLAVKINTVSGQIGSCLPVRCELCGCWGYSHVPGKWICDSCLSIAFHHSGDVRHKQTHDVCAEKTDQLELPIAV